MKTERAMIGRKIVEVLQEHPEGLTMERLADLVLERHAASRGSIRVTVSRLANEEYILRGERERCPHCNASHLIYRAK